MTEGGAGTTGGGRLRVMASVLLFMLAALTTRLWFLQVVANAEYEGRAHNNQVRLVPDPAPRGKILDRRGVELVSNRDATVITVEKREVKNAEAFLLRLSEVTEIPVTELAERYGDPDFGPYEPVPLVEDANEEDVLYLEEHAREFPGIGYRTVGIREYPFGPIGAHVLGYLGQINSEEIDQPAFSKYRPGQLVGRGGVEQQYERFLHGQDGWVSKEVDARGEEKGELGRRRPVRGMDVVLSLDQKAQEAAEDALRQGVKAAKGIYHEDSGRHLKAPAGAVVVLDPNTGEVIAMASYPTYDPEVFYQGLTFGEYDKLLDPSRNFPLNNRAIQAVYPPGSTLKPFVAAAAIKAGYASAGGFYPCPAEFTVPGDTSGTVFHNWKDTDQGVISFSRALIDSCDTVFYQFGLEFYRERKIRGELLQQMLRAWGFDRDTGIDLPFEADGRVPDVAWKAGIHEAKPEAFPDPVWYPGDTINMSIGQGDFIVTPLQLAQAFGALANGGTIYQPQVGLRVLRPDGTVHREFRPKVTGRVPFSKRTLGAIVNALEGVPVSGTGASAFAGFPLSSIPVAGKTGTSEVLNKQPHSWFAAIAPADAPRYVVVAVVEEGGHGSEVAAPIVRRIMEQLFGLEPSEFRVGAVTD